MADVRIPAECQADFGGLKQALDRLYSEFNYPDSAADPIQIVRRFRRRCSRFQRFSFSRRVAILSFFILSFTSATTALATESSFNSLAELGCPISQNHHSNGLAAGTAGSPFNLASARCDSSST